MLINGLRSIIEGLEIGSGSTSEEENYICEEIK
jgi:hypothetical protein